MILLVGPASAAAETCRRDRPSHVVSLVSPGDEAPPVPAGTHRLVLAFNDIAAPRDGLAMPVAQDIADLLAFARGWDGARPLLVHCGAGISRSTAAALAIACDRRPVTRESTLAEGLREASPHATPNARMVALADAYLGRGGRLIAAVAALGRGADWVPDPSFRLVLPQVTACPVPA